MKNIITFFLLIITSIGFSQENTNDQSTNLNEINNKKHEIKIDALEALIIPTLDISYEYVLNKYSGVGATIHVNLEGNGDTFEQDFALTGFF